MTFIPHEDQVLSAPSSFNKVRLFIRHNIIGICIGLVIGILMNQNFLSAIPFNLKPITSSNNQLAREACVTTKEVSCEKFYQGLENATWVEYNSKFYSFELPSGVRIFESKESPLLRNSDDVILATHINKEGPTQIHETESYDGIYLEFILLPKKGLSLQQIAQNSFEEASKEDVDAGIGFKQSSIGDYSAWEYTYTAYLGAKYIFLEKNAESQEYLRIVDMTKDPTNQGFESMVNKIVASITF